MRDSWECVSLSSTQPAPLYRESEKQRQKAELGARGGGATAGAELPWGRATVGGATEGWNALESAPGLVGGEARQEHRRGAVGLKDHQLTA